MCVLGGVYSAFRREGRIFAVSKSKISVICADGTVHLTQRDQLRKGLTFCRQKNVWIDRESVIPQKHFARAKYKTRRLSQLEVEEKAIVCTSESTVHLDPEQQTTVNNKRKTDSVADTCSTPEQQTKRRTRQTATVDRGNESSHKSTSNSRVSVVASSNQKKVNASKGGSKTEIDSYWDIGQYEIAKKKRLPRLLNVPLKIAFTGVTIDKMVREYIGPIFSLNFYFTSSHVRQWVEKLGCSVVNDCLNCDVLVASKV